MSVTELQLPFRGRAKSPPPFVDGEETKKSKKPLASRVKSALHDVELAPEVKRRSMERMAIEIIGMGICISAVFGLTSGGLSRAWKYVQNKSFDLATEEGRQLAAAFPTKDAIKAAKKAGEAIGEYVPTWIRALTGFGVGFRETFVWGSQAISWFGGIMLSLGALFHHFARTGSFSKPLPEAFDVLGVRENSTNVGKKPATQKTTGQRTIRPT